MQPLGEHPTPISKKVKNQNQKYQYFLIKAKFNCNRSFQKLKRKNFWVNYTEYLFCHLLITHLLIIRKLFKLKFIDPCVKSV